MRAADSSESACHRLRCRLFGYVNCRRCRPDLVHENGKRLVKLARRNGRFIGYQQDGVIVIYPI